MQTRPYYLPLDKEKRSHRSPDVELPSERETHDHLCNLDETPSRIESVLGFRQDLSRSCRRPRSANTQGILDLN